MPRSDLVTRRTARPGRGTDDGGGHVQRVLVGQPRIVHRQYLDVDDAVVGQRGPNDLAVQKVVADHGGTVDDQVSLSCLYTHDSENRRNGVTDSAGGSGDRHGSRGNRAQTRQIGFDQDGRDLIGSDVNAQRNGHTRRPPLLDSVS